MRAGAAVPRTCSRLSSWSRLLAMAWSMSICAGVRAAAAAATSPSASSRGRFIGAEGEGASALRVGPVGGPGRLAPPPTMRTD